MSFQVEAKAKAPSTLSLSHINAFHNSFWLSEILMQALKKKKKLLV